MIAVTAITILETYNYLKSNHINKKSLLLPETFLKSIEKSETRIVDLYNSKELYFFNISSHEIQ